MTEKKRFEYKNHKVFDNLTGEEHSSNMVSVNVLNQLARVNREGVKKVQKLAKENEQLKESNERFSKTVAEQIIMIKEYREKMSSYLILKRMCLIQLMGKSKGENKQLNGVRV